MVGCVVARDSKVITEGFHRCFGEAHAEAAALETCEESLAGATMYVTLEPCNHHGKTKPCTEAILNSSIKRVVIAALDPNPVASGGIGFLRSKGIQCDVGLLQSESKNLNRPFFVNIEKGRPMIALKLALTMDGRIARRDGSSKWITSMAARKRVHHLRAGYQAILVGRQTYLQDDPELTCRLVRGRDPIRVCLDEAGTLPSRLKAFREGKVLYFSSKFRLDLPSHIEQIIVSQKQGYEGLWPIALEEMKARGIISLLVEGGGVVTQFLLQRDCVDFAHLFYGPKIFGEGAVPGFRGPEERAFQLFSTQRLGDSFLLEGRFRCSQEL
jgi:diaminohydroxyphosphoribosylaminopyrimidine deaminase/5-amino-6-(5-phosphoribosylamino)uracil reductase